MSITFKERKKERTLVILRGVSGAGKSTVADFLAGKSWPVFEADLYHYDQFGNYAFDIKNLPAAHKWCQDQVEWGMKRELYKIIVSNTSTTEKELKPYLDLAEEYGYRVLSLIVENRHGNNSIHSVPQHVRDAQETRLRGSIKLQ